MAKKKIPSSKLRTGKRKIASRKLTSRAGKIPSRKISRPKPEPSSDPNPIPATPIGRPADEQTRHDAVSLLKSQTEALKRKFEARDSQND